MPQGARATARTSPTSLLLSVATNRRYLQGSDGRPFLLCGDSGWCLTVQLTRPQVDQYLDDRKAKGFNAILLEVVEDEFGAAAPANAYGNSPFVGGDFTNRSEPYWQHIDYIINAAAQRGIVVWMCALYFGFDVAGSHPEGWLDAAEAAGAAAIENYGSFLGARYRAHNNIVWVNGGDHRETTPTIANALATGILSQDTRHLVTTHWARDSTGTDGSPSWLTLNCSYTSQSNTASRVRTDYNNHVGSLPTHLIEAHYEGSFQGGPTRTGLDTSRQAWQALLEGSCGQFFGNHTIWQFLSGWESSLGSSGAVYQQHLHSFFRQIRWWDLVPDSGSAMVTAGRGTLATSTYVTAGKTSDGRLGVVHIPGGGQITVALSQFTGPIVARWFDCATGAWSSAGSFSNSGSQNFDPSGTADATLLLEAT